MVQQTDGGYAIAGWRVDGDDQDIWVLKTDSTGNRQYLQSFGGAGEDGVRSIIQTTDGGLVLAGYTKSYGASGEDAWLLKIVESEVTESIPSFEYVVVTLTLLVFFLSRKRKQKS